MQGCNPMHLPVWVPRLRAKLVCSQKEPVAPIASDTNADEVVGSGGTPALTVRGPNNSDQAVRCNLPPPTGAISVVTVQRNATQWTRPAERKRTCRCAVPVVPVLPVPPVLVVTGTRTHDGHEPLQSVSAPSTNRDYSD